MTAYSHSCWFPDLLSEPLISLLEETFSWRRILSLAQHQTLMHSSPQCKEPCIHFMFFPLFTPIKSFWGICAFPIPTHFMERWNLTEGRGGGPRPWWGNVSTEGKLLFVCLSLTLGLPFISLQGCRSMFTLGQLFSDSPSVLTHPLLLFMLSLKALLDDHQGLPLKLSGAHFCVLNSNYPNSPLSAKRPGFFFYLVLPVEEAPFISIWQVWHKQVM